MKSFHIMQRPGSFGVVFVPITVLTWGNMAFVFRCCLWCALHTESSFLQCFWWFAFRSPSANIPIQPVHILSLSFQCPFSLLLASPPLLTNSGCENVGMRLALLKPAFTFTLALMQLYSRLPRVTFSFGRPSARTALTWGWQRERCDVEEDARGWWERFVDRCAVWVSAAGWSHS